MEKICSILKTMEGLSNYEKQVRPWGNFERFTFNEPCTVKLVSVNEGEAISLQTHENRDEFWRVLTGSGTIIVGEETRPAKPGDSFFTPRGAKHRIEGGSGGLTILEIAFGDFNEQDIKRLEDKYGRG